jgi:adenylate cyclase
MWSWLIFIPLQMLRLGLPLGVMMLIVILNPMDIRKRAQNASLDILNQAFPFTAHPEVIAKLVFVDIDEQSLAKMGQWPWPRQITARLIDRLNTAAPLAIGVDILMPEPDRVAPAAIHALTGADLAQLEAILPDGDDILAKALAQDNIVTGFGLLPYEHKEAAVLPQSVATIGVNPHAIVAAPGILPNTPRLQVSKAAGFVSLSLDHDQIIRRIPLVVRYQDQVIPSLSLEMLRVAQAGSTQQGHVMRLAGQAGDPVALIRTGQIITSTDEQGQLTIHHGYSKHFTRLSAADIFADPSQWADQITGALVVIGSSATGLKDHHATPLEASLAGPYLHLGVLAQILSGRVIYHSQILTLIAWGLVILIGLILPILLHQRSMRTSLGSFAFILISVPFIHIVGFIHYGWVGNMVMDMVMLFGVGVVHLTLRAIREERRRRHLKSAFSRYLAPQMVRRIETSATAPHLGGERRMLTIMFLDIRGFTTLSEHLRDQPEALTGLISHFMDAITELLLAHGATLDKYIGDAVMAFWNAPLEQVDHADKAICCGRAIIAALPDINRDLAQNHGITTPLHIGIGIASGDVVVGNLGSRFRFSYSCLGDAVNLAARLEGVVKETGLPLSVAESTIKAATMETGLTEVAEILVRGKSEQIKVFSDPHLI